MRFVNDTYTAIQLQFGNAVLGPIGGTVLFADPALFRLKPGFSTQAAALNEDGTVNGASNPARAGSVISVWGTGFGPLAQFCATGNLNGPAAVNLGQGITALVNGGGTAGPKVQYAGGAPFLLCGIQQINVLIPEDTSPGLVWLYPWSNLDTANSHLGVQTYIGASVVVR